MLLPSRVVSRSGLYTFVLYGLLSSSAIPARAGDVPQVAKDQSQQLQGQRSKYRSLAERSDRKAEAARARVKSCEEELAGLGTGSFRLPEKQLPPREIVLKQLIVRYGAEAAKWEKLSAGYRDKLHSGGVDVD